MRRQLRGVVTSDKNAKTIRVEVSRRFRHPRYGKIIRSRTICHTHDEHNVAKMGDLVDIIESRPRSALKRWELVAVVNKADEAVVAATAEADEVSAAPEAGTNV